ncbi:hypothetical protein JCM8547_005436 [Rhodosporidiobolus lusitaniae]
MPVVSLSPLHFSEGFLTIDVVLRLVGSTLLNPALSWVLPVGALARSLPSPSPSTLISLLRDPSALLHLARTNTPLQLALAVYGVGAALWVNAQLSRAARNSFKRSTRAWRWDERGEVVVVTGGAGGLGSEVVRRLAEKGTRVVVLDVAPLPSDAPSTIKYYKVNLASKEEVDAAASKIIEEVGHPTVLINMAGVVRAQSILDMTAKDVDLTYDINVKAAYYTVQAFLPHMAREGHGHVITIASSTGYHQAATGVAYCSSKAAALSFHEGLTEELRHLYPSAPSSPNAAAIRTSVICPAHFKTGMFAGFANSIPAPFAPSLEVGTVAKLVCETVWSGESQHIIEPFYAKCTPLGRALPTWLYGIILSFAKDAMGAVKEYKSKHA